MVAMGLDRATGKGMRLAAPALDAHAVGQHRDGQAHGGQTVGHHLDAVGFLHAQLFGPAQLGHALGAGRGNEERRELVDGQRHPGRVNGDALETPAAHVQVGHRLAPHQLRVGFGDVGAHGTQHVQHADTRGVHAHMTQDEIRAGADGRCHQEEGCRRDVGRHVHPRRTQHLPAAHRRRGPLAPHLHAEGRQHPFGMVARGRRFRDARLAVGIQPGQQQRRLHLGAGHRQLQVHGREPVHRLHLQRRLAVLAVDARAHPRERIDHPPHGAARQAGIAHHPGGKALAGQNAAQEPHRGARVAAVQVAGRRLQAMQPHAMHLHLPLVRTIDAHAHCPEDLGGGQGIGAFQEAMDFRHALGQRAQHDGAVRDGLVTRYPDVALHLPARCHVICLKHE